jgi:hypothetical protein
VQQTQPMAALHGTKGRSLNPLLLLLIPSQLLELLLLRSTWRHRRMHCGHHFCCARACTGSQGQKARCDRCPPVAWVGCEGLWGVGENFSGVGHRIYSMLTVGQNIIRCIYVLWYFGQGNHQIYSVYKRFWPALSMQDSCRKQRIAFAGVNSGKHHVLPTLFLPQYLQNIPLPIVFDPTFVPNISGAK